MPAAATTEPGTSAHPVAATTVDANMPDVEAATLAAHKTRPRDCMPPGRLHDDSLDLVAHAGVAMLTGGLSPISAALACLDWGMHLAISPGKCLELGAQAWRNAAAAVRFALPGAPEEAGQDADAGGGTAIAASSASRTTMTDPRFKEPAWSIWPFSAYRDAFLRTQQWWSSATSGVPGVDRHHEDVVRFMARQWIDACSPGNFVATNPVVLETTARSGGMNFVAGLRHWGEDVSDLAKHVGGAPVHAPLEYEPGRDVAITPGKVVWRNDLCELLQYDPLTPTVAREPVFIVPSWIMKYYILDLQPHNSMIRYLVEQGFTVFVLSWHNPGAEARDLCLNDYLQRGALAALDEVRARCGEPVHAVGYCLGGTLLAIAAAALARDGRAAELASVSLLAAQTDFTEPGELGLFIDASELAALDALMWRQGYLDGSQMAATFQLLNARDLVWSRMMSEYLMGRRLKPNDLMAWNADTTRMPYRMHIEYLNDLFMNNDLADGRYCVDGRPVALSDIEQPMFVVGTERDHVSPWRSVYKLLLYTHNPLTFVLTAGGHNAGIVSEPGHPRRYYRSATRGRGAPYRSQQEYFDATEPVEGSWWTGWASWLHQQSHGAIDARAVEGGLADAPGAYIFER
ncbi:polyhydroxyalkanoate synthase [Paraburkholderia caballeronis]|nr:polyhydroxyalkanoate synthase [Paraburkholderia caballeronis]TDV15377.1 polyhydroxyalkanoate synthase [Paraburkholderia caballeronis]TDV24844.1 polyhydroxyalkanoate synthase [Paraburkholderia caballeronis]